MDRKWLLVDAQWDLIEPLLPPQRSGRGRPMRDHRQVVEGVIYRYRCGIAWRDLPAEFGPWQTVWKRHRRFSADGTWDKILAALLAQADAADQVNWTVSVDSTINRAHQHATNLPRESKQRPAVESGGTELDSDTAAYAVAGLLAPDTGGWIESQGSTHSPRSAVA
jgi:transposase